MELNDLLEETKEQIQKILRKGDEYGDGITIDFANGKLQSWGEAGYVCIEIKLKELQKVFDILNNNNVVL